MQDLDIRCKACDRFLGLKGVFSIVAQVRCPNSKCKQLNDVKVVNNQSSDAEIRYKFTAIIKEENTDE